MLRPGPRPAAGIGADEPNPFDGEPAEPVENTAKGKEYVVRVKGDKDIKVVSDGNAVEYKEVLKDQKANWRWNESYAKWCWSVVVASPEEAAEWIGWAESLECELYNANEDKNEPISLMADFVVMGEL